jgi:hypothetical protein
MIRFNDNTSYKVYGYGLMVSFKDNFPVWVLIVKFKAELCSSRS